jgi:signal-transduction protein with cAMP-binding, CBS, and nucleotidyltransferase domain
MNDIKNLIVQESSTLKSILTKINLNGKNGVFVVKLKKLVGVITDSDIRKKLLQKKLKMYSHAKEIMERNFLSIPFSKRKLSKKILIDSNKILIPIVKNNQLAGYVHTSDFYKKKNN